MKNFLKISAFILSLSNLGLTLKIQSSTEISSTLELSNRNDTISFLEKGNRFANFSAEKTIESMQSFEHFQLNGKETCDKLCALTLNYFFDVVQKKHSRDERAEKILADAFIDHQQFAQPFLSLMYSYVPQNHKAYKVLSSILKKYSKLKYGCVIKKEKINIWKLPCSPETLEVVEIMQNAYDTQGDPLNSPVPEGVHQARCLKNIYLTQALISQEKAQNFVASLFLPQQKMLLKALIIQMTYSPSLKRKLAEKCKTHFKKIDGKWLRAKLTSSRWAAKTHFNNGVSGSFWTSFGCALFFCSAMYGNQVNRCNFDGLNFACILLDIIDNKISRDLAATIGWGSAILCVTFFVLFLQQVAVRPFAENITSFI